MQQQHLSNSPMIQQCKYEDLFTMQYRPGPKNDISRHIYVYAVRTYVRVASMVYRLRKINPTINYIKLVFRGVLRAWVRVGRSI